MSETHVSHTKPCSRMRSLSESRGESKVTKPIFSNSGKRYSPIASPRRGSYLERRFNGGFFYVTGLGGLYLERLINGGAYFRNVTARHYNFTIPSVSYQPSQGVNPVN